MAETDLSFVPVRDYMDDPSITWATSKPNYDLVNRKYMMERTNRHKTGSLEKLVENLVKTWEMESSHKIKAKDWQSVDPSCFFIRSNGGRQYSLEDNVQLGNYNILMDACPLYAADKETNKSSHAIFKNVFKGGFAWELLELFSGPPKVAFTWRHWGTWEEPYRDVTPTGEIIEMTGSCVVVVTDKLKIQSIDVFYDPNPMMAKLTAFNLEQWCPMKK